ncbi:hypothetical protein NGH94_11580 [Staphylococcus equorum]|nr:hypothetical protein [Staphylococcus equorum]MEB8172377.1 hypothetical protein [Staphylococcus equorum]
MIAVVTALLGMVLLRKRRRKNTETN